MATIQIELPDELIQQAQQAGLLSPDRIELLLREGLKTTRIDALFCAMDKMANLEGVPYMSPEEVAQELAAMRPWRRKRICWSPATNRCYPSKRSNRAKSSP